MADTTVTATSEQDRAESCINDATGMLPIAEVGQLHWVKRPLSTLSVLASSESANNGNGNGNGNDEAPGLWWPSLLFNDYDIFQDFFVDELKPENDAAETKGLILTRMLQNMLQQNSIMIARLLGRSISEYVEIVQVSTDTGRALHTPLEAHQAAEFVSFTRMPQEVHLPQMKPEAFIFKISDSSIAENETAIIDDDLYMSYMLALDLAATKRMSGPQAPNQNLRSDFRKLGRSELKRLPHTVKKLSDEVAVPFSELHASASGQAGDVTTDGCGSRGKTRDECVEKDKEDSDGSDSEDEDRYEQERKVGDQHPRKTKTSENSEEADSASAQSSTRNETCQTHEGDGTKKETAEESMEGDLDDTGKSETASEASALYTSNNNVVLDVADVPNENGVSNKNSQEFRGGKDTKNGEKKVFGKSVVPEAESHFSANNVHPPNDDGQDAGKNSVAANNIKRGSGNAEESGPETSALPQGGTDVGANAMNLPIFNGNEIQENSVAANDTKQHSGNAEESGLESSALPQDETDVSVHTMNLPNANGNETQEAAISTNDSNEDLENVEKYASETMVLADAGTESLENIPNRPKDDKSRDKVNSEKCHDVNLDTVHGNDGDDLKDAPSSLSSSSATVVSQMSDRRNYRDAPVPTPSPAAMTTTPSPTTTFTLTPTPPSCKDQNRGHGTEGVDAATAETTSPATVSKSLAFCSPFLKKPRKRGPGHPRKDAGIKRDDSFDRVCYKLERVGWTIDVTTENYFRPNVSHHDIKMNPQWRGQKFFLSKAAFLIFLKETYSWPGKKTRTPLTKVGRKCNDLSTTPSDVSKKIDRGGNIVTPTPSNRPKRSRRTTSLCGDDSHAPVLRRKQFHFKSTEEEYFYNFRSLIKKLQRKCGWKYVAGKTYPWHYVLPGCKTEARGGLHLIDFFFEESEVIQYCLDNEFYEKREELGLEDDC